MEEAGKRVAVIGAGISGLAVAQLLSGRAYDVALFEKEDRPGGLIRCRREKGGGLFHLCGGHVFNTRRQDVADWFWAHFNRVDEFVKADRNSAILMADGTKVPYPIENHVYKLGREIQMAFIQDLLRKSSRSDAMNFEEFLVERFGSTLYGLYFGPYNMKVWGRPLRDVPLSWLEGKLPMPSAAEMIYNNINRVEEREFVHSSFYYEKDNGSQFIADRLAEGLHIRYGFEVKNMDYRDGQWFFGNEAFDKVVFCGNIKQLPGILERTDFLRPYASRIAALRYHGTTSVFCRLDENPYSWIYLPDMRYKAHRIICTGNFSRTNNPDGGLTGTVEFTGAVPPEEILRQLALMPYHPQYIAHHYSEYSYPVQDMNTRKLVGEVKSVLSGVEFYLSGRFADWEYYNMDAAIGVAMDLCGNM